MTDYTNRPIIFCAKAGVVTGQSEKRGKVLLSVRMDDGREIKVALASVEFRDVERFAPRATGPMFTPKDRDYYGDQARMFARNPGWR